jgi:hypothetical protein
VECIKRYLPTALREIKASIQDFIRANRYSKVIGRRRRS